MLLGLGPGPGSVPPSRFFGWSNKVQNRPSAAQSLRLWSFPAIMASGGSGRPPGTPALLVLGLLGLFSLDAYETRRDSQKPLQLELKPLKTREGAFCPSHQVMAKLYVPWLFRHN